MMSDRFKKAFDELMFLEGFVSNNPRDPGGLTVWGISSRFHPDLFADGKRPTRADAQMVYYAEYWKPYLLDDLRSDRLAFEVFEAGVNCGMELAVKWLQSAFNRLKKSRGESDFLVVDGHLGPRTLASVNSFCLRPSGENALYRLCNWYQGQHYLELESLEENLLGWFGRRLD